MKISKKQIGFSMIVFMLVQMPMFIGIFIENKLINSLGRLSMQINAGIFFIVILVGMFHIYQTLENK